MGYYTTDPAELARSNAGLPPDEHVGVIYVMDERELAAHETHLRATRSLPQHKITAALATMSI